MGWYSHPDTLSIARASGTADRTGRTEDSLDWIKAYRDAYAAQNKDQPYGDSLDSYLKDVDAQIATRTAQQSTDINKP